jgi:hypothetical protein
VLFYEKSGLAGTDDVGRSIGDHVKGVVASINALIDPLLTPTNFMVHSGNPLIDGKAAGLMSEAHTSSWFREPALLRSHDDTCDFAHGLLRIAALYHDLGKLVSTDHHVSRGVHLMRDVRDDYRQQVENLLDDPEDRSMFWALLRHHDIYGCLCTGEASLPAMSDMVGWAHTERPTRGLDRSVGAYLTYLLWLNIADSDAQLRSILGGITAVEAYRYLSDWEELKEYLLDAHQQGHTVKREEFRDWLLGVDGHPDRTVRRITRLVATCYRKEMNAIPPESEIQTLVEEELRALHGARLEDFCYCFARFCKLDYGLRFFYILMRDTLLEEGLLKRADSSKDNEFPAKVELREQVDEQARLKSLRKMVDRTCFVLDRIVEDYGHLVTGDQRSSPLLGVNMSGLMRPENAGWAICQSLKKYPSRALGWIGDEIGVWVYGE